MADNNTQYQGFVESFDFDAQYNWLIQHGGLFSVGAQAFVNSAEGQAQRANTIKFNQESQATVTAVKVAYTGSTDAERLAWLTERLQAIETRADFIKTRGDSIIESLTELGSTGAGDIFLSLWGAAFSIGVPVFGSLISSLFVGGYRLGKSDTIADLQTKLQYYSTDIQQLAAIKTTLKKELASTDPTSNAPTPWPTWYYFVGAGLLLLLFFWYRSKRAKRRKR